MIRLTLHRSGQTQQHAFIESFNSSPRDELLYEEFFDILGGPRRKRALWHYDHNIFRPHSSLRNKTYAEARRTLEQIERSAPGALAKSKDNQC